MSTPENNQEETTQKKPTNKSRIGKAVGGYLFAIIILAIAIHWGNIEIDRGYATGEDNPIFIGIFIYLAGGLIFVSSALGTFVMTRKQKDG